MNSNYGSSSRLAALTVIALVVIGSLAIAVRLKAIYKSHLPRGESVWRLTYDIDFPAVKGVKIHIAIPSSTPDSRVFRESFSHQGIWMDILRTKRTLGREAVIVPVVGSEQGRFIAQFDIHLRVDKDAELPDAKAQLTAEEMADYLQEDKTIQITDPHVLDVLNQLTDKQANKSKVLERIFEYCSENIVRSGLNNPSDALGTLQKGSGTTLGRARAMIALCRAAKIPARLATGFLLEPNLDARKHYWVEVYSKKNWLPCDPENGYFGELPATFLPVRRDGSDIVRIPGTSEYRARYSVRRLLPPPAMGAWPKNHLWNIVDLTRLPPGMQEVVTLIQLLPLGALITAIFRNIIGIRTFGTFTPALIALSFVQADWRTGAVVFFVVLTIGILARLVLNKLQLLMVARLGVILTLVVLCMILAVSMLDYLNLTPSASAVLLPMVILTMMIERFNITVEEDGYQEALRIFAGTLVVAICCFFVLRVQEIGRFLLTFPEIQLFIVAALLLIGRYSGYRLTELRRFRDITQG
jgi:transglutaminase-like putative cysteine protease